MGKIYNSITPELSDWLMQQKVFFVATAPLAQSGHVNCLPQRGDTFRVLGDREVAYLDLTGSGIETAAHLQENGRIVLMFCAFDGPPKSSGCTERVRSFIRRTHVLPGRCALSLLMKVLELSSE
jgi:hypothetical protein